MKTKAISTLAIILGAGGGYAGDLYFHDVVGKGINMPYVFGNSTHLFAKDSSVSATNPLGVYYGQARLNNVLVPTDFDDLWAKGFRSVRIPIDPIIFGCTATNPTLSVDPYFTGSTNSPWQALMQTVSDITGPLRAGGNHMSVILDLHPIVLSQRDYGQLTASWGITNPKPWTGPWMQNWAIATTTPNGSEPLVQFWSSFAQKLAVSGVGDNPYVVLEVLNEPGTRMKTGFGTNLEEPQGTTASQLIGWGNDNWRELQRLAINAIQQHLSETFIIATTWKSEPKDLIDDVGFDVYDSGEVFAYDYVAYNVHLYYPFRYTLHPWPTSTAPDYNYRKNRDYDATTPVEDPENAGAPMTANSNDRRMLLSGLDNLFLWRIYNGSPAVTVTEFGSNKRSEAFYGLGFQQGENPPPPESEAQKLFRAQWHYDARKLMETWGVPWVVYEYLGNKRMFEGYYELNSSQPTVHSGILNRVWVSPALQQGMFGSTRP